MNWLAKTKIKHLLTEKEDVASVRESMAAIHAVIKGDSAWMAFSRPTLAKFLKVPEGDAIFGPVDYANKLIAAMYDYADDNRIWIE